MRVVVDREYPVSVEKLYEIITSKAFFEQRFAWGDVDDYRFDAFEETPEGMLIRIAQPVRIKTDKIPGFARRLVPEQGELVTEFLWRPAGGDNSSGYQARYRFQLGGVPMNVEGGMVLEADGENHAIQHTEVTLSSSVPLVGKKLVSLLAPKVDDALAGDYRQTLRYVQSCS
ncbi:hypothetical protein Q670_05515 [Alcanivorax sp. P2S70]|uniref:DUF2505 domain-containing protein n=1 Tax=Alcanivorax sp. P2S70 TaxID=1397527 RepID=UPI0003B64B13|nr:DUF2505 domain-containing protein [Alcanivorax sp. P2S70]ERP86627.1 hypothetical protein Q670_05515 [Alcanivorax sp. P2S70]